MHQVDASQVGAGAVLRQKDEQGAVKPVSFFSKKFSQNRFSKTECLVILPRAAAFNAKHISSLKNVVILFCLTEFFKTLFLDGLCKLFG